MRSVDTNVLIRLVTGDDPRQAEKAKELVAPGAWVSHLVLAEALWVLDTVYDLDAKALAQAVDLLLNHKELTLQDADVIGAALEHYRKRPALGFSDCLILEIARKAGHLPLGTFDKELAKLPGAVRLS